jgi:hypothetical protein
MLSKQTSSPNQYSKLLFTMILLGLAPMPVGANPLTIPANPSARVEQGGEVGWGTYGASVDAGFVNFTKTADKRAFQVGFLSASPVHAYRRELITFRLPSLPAGKREVAKAELRLVSNGVQDKTGQLDGRELQFFHTALTVTPEGNDHTTEANSGTPVATLRVDLVPGLGKEIRFDVTEALRAQLKAGERMVGAFRIQLSDDLDIKPGSDAFVQFRGFHSPVAADRPLLELSFR